MNKNLFDSLEVFAPFEEKVIVQETKPLKKQQNLVKQNLRENYQTEVQKPGQSNKLGNKTIRSAKEDKQPKHERDFDKKVKKPHGQNEVQEEMR